MVTTREAAADDRLRSADEAADNFCPACGYALSGLPAAGICPECGRAYSPDVVVLYGYGRGEHANVATAPRRFLVGLSLLCALCYLPFLLGPSRGAVLRGLFPVGVVGVSLWMRRTQAHPGTVQARLNRLGCVQHINAVDPTARMVASFVWVGIFVLLLADAVIDGDGAVYGMACALLFVGVIVVIARRSERRKRRAVVRAGLVPGLTDDLHTTTPTMWAATGSVSAERTRAEGRYRLKVETPYAQLRLTSSVIDIEVETTAARIGALVEQIRAWQTESRTPA